MIVSDEPNIGIMTPTAVQSGFDLVDFFDVPITSDFQEKVNVKREFAELASRKDEKLAEGKPYFKHQDFAERVLRTKNEILIIDETGTGKTCTVTKYLDYAQQQSLIKEADPTLLFKKTDVIDEFNSHFKRALILVKSKTQEIEMKRQIICQCTQGRYLSKSIRNARFEWTQKQQVTKKLGVWYTIDRFETFVNKLIAKYFDKETGRLDAEKVAKDYSDIIVWIDEGHNLIIDPEEFGDEEEGLLEKRRKTTKKKKRRDVSAPGRKKAKKIEIYPIILDFLRSIKRSKRIVTTATPSINNPSDLTSVMNLILNEDQAIPKSFKYNTTVLEHYEQYFKDRILYVRALETGAFSTDIGDDITIELTEQDKIENDIKDLDPNVHPIITLDLDRMSLYQGIGNTLSELGETGTGMTKKVVRKGLSIEASQSSASVFPDGWWGYGRTTEDKLKQREQREEKRKAEQLREELIIKAGGYSQADYVGAGGRTYEEFDLDFGELGGGEAELKHAYWRYIVSGEKGLSFGPSEEFKQWFRKDYLAESDDESKEEFIDEFGEVTFRKKGVPEDVDEKFEDVYHLLSHIEELSIKARSIIDTIIKKNSGSSFVYSSQVGGSGLKLFCTFLMLLGFEIYDGTNPMFESAREGELADFCVTQGDTSVAKVRIAAKPRFAVLSNDTPDAIKDDMMRAMNSYENRHGEYIKVLVTSRVGRDGINVANVVNGHLYMPEWNESHMYQALSRFIRSTSHDALLNEIREKNEIIIKNNEEEIRTAKEQDREPTLEPLLEERVIVNVHRHCAFNVWNNLALSIIKFHNLGDEKLDYDTYAKYEYVNLEKYEKQISVMSIEDTDYLIKNFEDNKNNLEDLIRQSVPQEYASYENEEEFDEKYIVHETQAVVNSADFEMYRTSKLKDIRIKRVMRILRKFAIGCNVHYTRNVRPEDEDYSARCDYDICAYDCATKSPIAHADYLKIYSEAEIDSVRRRIIKERIHDLGIFHISKILRVDEKLVDIAVKRLKTPPERWYELEQRINSKLDYSTYDSTYSGKEVDDLISSLINLFKENQLRTSYSVTDLLEMYRGVRYEILMRALEKLPNNKAELTDSYGFKVYLAEASGILFITRSFPDENTTQASRFYSKYLIGYETKSVSETFEHRSFEDSKRKLIRAHAYFDPLDAQDAMNVDAFISQFDRLGIEQRIYFLEDCIARYNRGENAEQSIIMKYVLKRYEFIWFELREQETRVEALQKKKGKKSEIETITIDTTTQKIYIHLLYSQQTDRTNYRVSSQYHGVSGRLRIFIDDAWRNVTVTENAVYKSLIKDIKDKQQKTIMDTQIAGNQTVGGFKIFSTLGLGKMCTGTNNKFVIQYVLRIRQYTRAEINYLTVIRTLLDAMNIAEESELSDEEKATQILNIAGYILEPGGQEESSESGEEAKENERIINKVYDTLLDEVKTSGVNIFRKMYRLLHLDFGIGYYNIIETLTEAELFALIREHIDESINVLRTVFNEINNPLMDATTAEEINAMTGQEVIAKMEADNLLQYIEKNGSYSLSRNQIEALADEELLQIYRFFRQKKNKNLCEETRIALERLGLVIVLY